MMIRRKFPRGCQVNKINLSLDNSELDKLWYLFKEDRSPMAEHVRQKLRLVLVNNKQQKEGEI